MVPEPAAYNHGRRGHPELRRRAAGTAGQYGNGWYRYLDDPQQAEATFSRDNWLALSTPFADQTRAQVTWDPSVVRAWRIIGYENRITSDASFTEERKEFAEIYSGASTTAF